MNAIILGCLYLQKVFRFGHMDIMDINGIASGFVVNGQSFFAIYIYPYLFDWRVILIFRQL